VNYSEKVNFKACVNNKVEDLKQRLDDFENQIVNKNSTGGIKGYISNSVTFIPGYNYFNENKIKEDEMRKRQQLIDLATVKFRNLVKTYMNVKDPEML
jgi:hypothetical protein